MRRDTRPTLICSRAAAARPPPPAGGRQRSDVLSSAPPAPALAPVVGRSGCFGTPFCCDSNALPAAAIPTTAPANRIAPPYKNTRCPLVPTAVPSPLDADPSSTPIEPRSWGPYGRMPSAGVGGAGGGGGVAPGWRPAATQTAGTGFSAAACAGVQPLICEQPDSRADTGRGGERALPQHGRKKGLSETLDSEDVFAVRCVRIAATAHMRCSARWISGSMDRWIGDHRSGPKEMLLASSRPPHQGLCAGAGGGLTVPLATACAASSAGDAAPWPFLSFPFLALTFELHSPHLYPVQASTMCRGAFPPSNHSVNASLNDTPLILRPQKPSASVAGKWETGQGTGGEEGEGQGESGR